jgi:hypothetical protein
VVVDEAIDLEDAAAQVASFAANSFNNAFTSPIEAKM